MENKSVKLIEKLSDANGVSGFEDEVVSIAKTELENYGTIEVDHILNCIVKSNNNTGTKPIVLLDAHSDEVGFIVQAVMPNGMIKFLPVGGWINSNVAAHTVRIRNRSGKYIRGIIASCPPHFMSAASKESAVTIDDMVIDVGSTSYEETTNYYGIRIGNPIIPDVKFDYNEDTGIMFGKAFDCRIGCACLIESFKELSNKKLDVDLIACLSSQEEVGMRGIKAAMNNVIPDIAIVFEGCPADDTFTPDWLIQTALRKGPMLRHFDVSMVTNPRFQKYALDMAHNNNIPVQEAVRKGGGTNGAIINAVRNGVPAIVIGIPVRFAHTHYCYVAKEDYDAAMALAVKIVESLNADVISSF